MASENVEKLVRHVRDHFDKHRYLPKLDSRPVRKPVQRALLKEGLELESRIKGKDCKVRISLHDSDSSMVRFAIDGKEVHTMPLNDISYNSLAVLTWILSKRKDDLDRLVKPRKGGGMVTKTYSDIEYEFGLKRSTIAKKAIKILEKLYEM